MRKKAGLINETSATKGGLKVRLKLSRINFGQGEYYRLIRVDEK